MPNRLIRDGILESERYLSLKHVESGLLFFELVLLADDYGIVEIKTPYLIRRTLAGAKVGAVGIGKAISDLVDVGLLMTYEIDGRQFGLIPRFRTARGGRMAAKPKHPFPSSGPVFNEIRELEKIARARTFTNVNPRARTPDADADADAKYSAAKAGIGINPNTGIGGAW